MVAPESLLGTVLHDRYRLVQHFASGGIGHLYVVEDEHSRGSVKSCFAAKILRLEHLDNPVLHARFAREIDATSRVNDAHAPSILHHGHLSNGAPYFISELLTGIDLADVLDLQKSLAPCRAVHIATQIARGLAVVHAAGVVHRDLKPENVFLVQSKDSSERIKLLDFGLAWITNDQVQAQSARLTLTRTVVGTPEYASPEQTLGDIGRCSADIYSLGIVLYEMLAGVVPFQGSPDVVAGKHLQIKPRPLDRGSIALRQVVERSLEKDPSNRYPSALEMADALGATPEGQQNFAANIQPR